MLLTISILSIIGIAVYIYFNVVIKKFKHLNIPIVYGFPIVGNYPYLGANFQKFQKYLSQREFIYGHKLFGLLFGKNLEIVCAEAELTSQILGSEKHQRKGFIFRNLNSVIDGGLANRTGTKFEKEKQILTSALSPEFLQKIIPDINKWSDNLVENLRKLKHIREDVLPLIERYASSTIFKSLLGDTIEDPRILLKLLQECCEIDTMRTFSYWKRCDFLYSFSSLSKRQNNIKKEVDKILKESIENRGKLVNIEKTNTPFLLDVLLGDLANVDFSDIKDILLDLIINSNDVLSSLIGFTLYELATEYKIQEKLLEEINAVGINSGSELTVKQINDMEYLNLVFKETLRFYPTKIFSEFTLAENIEYKNVTLPKGASILIDIQGIHQHINYFANSLVYDPNRYLPEYMKRNNHSSFVPFGEGFKTYLGHSLVELEFKIAIIKIVQNFNIKKLDSFIAETKIYNNAIKPLNGIVVKLEHRVNTN